MVRAWCLVSVPGVGAWCWCLGAWVPGSSSLSRLVLFLSLVGRRFLFLSLFGLLFSFLSLFGLLFSFLSLFGLLFSFSFLIWVIVFFSFLIWVVILSFLYLGCHSFFFPYEEGVPQAT